MLLHEFLTEHKQELIARCRAKVLTRRAPRVTDVEIANGIPMFLGQLINTLKTDTDDTTAQMVSSAHLHGGELQRAGFTVEQVVHDYGDLCQAITEMAVESESDIRSDDFGTLNRCLDDAIAGAVAEYTRPTAEEIEDGFDDPALESAGAAPVGTFDRREAGTAGRRASGELAADTNRLIGSAAFELQALLKAAMLSFDTIKRGRVAANGSTGAALDRSLRGLRQVVDRSLLQLRLNAGMQPEDINVARLIADIDAAATLDALACGIRLTVIPVNESLTVNADRSVVLTVVAHLLTNAFKHTNRNGHHDVTLRVRLISNQVRIDVEDQCGGLPPGTAENLFWPFAHSNRGRPMVGDLGLAICRRSIEATGGTLHAQNRPTLGGCVFRVGLSEQKAPIRPSGAARTVNPTHTADTASTADAPSTPPSRMRTSRG
jgi:signal transduction histidine kinase